MSSPCESKDCLEIPENTSFFKINYLTQGLSEIYRTQSSADSQTDAFVGEMASPFGTATMQSKSDS